MTTTNQHGAKVGDVLVASWGYDQTNINFFAVVGVTKTGVKLLPRGSNLVSDSGGPSEEVVPGEIIREEEVRQWIEIEDGTHRCVVTGSEPIKPFFRKTREAWDGDGYVANWRNHTSLRRWSGSTERQTGLGWGH